MHMNSAQHTWEEDQAVNTDAFPVLLGLFPLKVMIRVL